jgi:hypothetical protein
MQIEIKVGRKEWRKADAVIDENGWARVKLPFPYGDEVYKVWRKIEKKRNGGKK